MGSESPRWLAKKLKYRDAYQVLLRLRRNPLLAARDLVQIRAQLAVETILFVPDQDINLELGSELPEINHEQWKKQTSLRNYARRIKQLVRVPRIRRATLAASIVMCAQ